MRKAALVALTVVVSATACSGGDSTGEQAVVSITSSTAAAPDDETTTSTTTAAPTTTAEATTTTTVAELTDEEQILAVIERFQDLVREGNDPPNPESSLWADPVISPLLADELRGIAARRLAEGLGLREEESLPVVVLELATAFDANSGAIVDFCYRDSAITYALTDGSVIDDSVIYIWAQYVLQSIDGRWVVVDTGNVGEFEEGAACVASLP